MTDQTSARDQPPPGSGPGPSFVAGPAPAGPGGPSPYGPPPAGYGAGATQPAPPAPDRYWGPDGLVSTPALPPERVARGAALALLAVPAGAIVSGVVWKLGFVASISGIVVAGLAAVLYLRGSGGRVRKGLPVVALVIALGVVASFFTAVAVDLWGYFPKLDPEVAATYPSRWSFVSENVFYPPLLKDYTRDVVLFAVFGVLGGFGTILRLVRVNARL